MFRNFTVKTNLQKADLHTHTVYSDGMLNPEELMELQIKAGIDVWAVTDHDTVQGAVKAAGIAGPKKIRVVIGCEFSSDYNGSEVHILAYGVDPESSTLKAFLKKNTDTRLSRAEEIVKKLNDLGYGISFDDMMQKVKAEAVGRPHIAAQLLEDGYVETYKEAFYKLLADRKPAFIEREKFSYAEVLDVIKKSGGISSYAHPEKGLKRSKLYDFAKEGLNGIEVIHPSESPHQTQLLRMKAKQFGLLQTGGSDFHGIRDYEWDNLGRFVLSKEHIEKFMKSIKF